MKTSKLPVVLLLGLGLFLSSPHSLPAADFNVLASGLSFTPSSLTIGVGDTVTWTSGGSHTTTSGATPPTPDGIWNSGTLTNTQTFSFTFANLAAGTYPYFCGFHYAFGMTGTITLTNVPATYLVVVTNHTFTPATLNIAQGDTVVWTNIGGFHTTTSGSVAGGAEHPDGLWNSSTIPLDGTYSLTFNGYAPRTYPYFCVPHGVLFGMVGSITVTNGTTVPPTLSNPALVQTNGQFQLTINGQLGEQYTLLNSTDLLTWLPVSTNVALSTSYAVTNLPPGAAPAGFYRALISH